MSSMNFTQTITVTDLAKRLALSREALLELSQGDEQQLYHSFKIKKKRGGHRLVQAPEASLKTVQYHIYNYLTLTVSDDVHKRAHGFVRKKSIVSNAQLHVGKSWVLNLDLENFFGSFTRADVVDLFTKPPFSFDEPVAQHLGNLCTTDQGLPQGAITSPMLSNLLSRELDEKLSEFAKNHYLVYSRYADDISFSSNGMIPAQLLAKDLVSRKWQLGSGITDLIEGCGFRINERKTRLQTEHQRQEVTGLIVNEQVNVDRRYVRNLRAMIHAYKTYGFLAVFKFINHYANQETEYKNPLKRFLNTIRGRIGFVAMVKGKDHPVVLKLKQDFEHAKAVRSEFKRAL